MEWQMLAPWAPWRNPPWPQCAWPVGCRFQRHPLTAWMWKRACRLALLQAPRLFASVHDVWSSIAMTSG
eukprot:2150128-Prorocentrum_lima.AAC.1